MNSLYGCQMITDFTLIKLWLNHDHGLSSLIMINLTNQQVDDPKGGIINMKNVAVNIQNKKVTPRCSWLWKNLELIIYILRNRGVNIRAYLKKMLILIKKKKKTSSMTPLAFTLQPSSSISSLHISAFHILFGWNYFPFLTPANFFFSILSYRVII